MNPENAAWVAVILFSLLLGYIFEVTSVHRTGKSVWTSLSTKRDKFVFATSLVVLYVVGVWPIKQQVGSIAVYILFVLLGGIIAVSIIFGFGSKDMKDKLFKRSRTL